eukprot:CCRYP_008428-RA/>CCRYP_008428-RA protein AED:0.23 eAED:0.27 QI:0/0/0/1/0/0/2/0/267
MHGTTWTLRGPTPPGLWKHVSRPVQFTLVVDKFGIKYVGEDNFNHLINALQQHYDVTIDKEGKLYCGITLDWEYHERTLDISMPGYVHKQLIKYNHPMPKSPQHCPLSPHPIQYGSKIQDPIPPNESPALDRKGIKFIQQVVGSFLYYCRATDTTIPAALSELSQQQTHSGKHAQTMQTISRLHGLAPQCNNLVLHIRHDTQRALRCVISIRPQCTQHLFLGSLPQPDKPILLNGIIPRPLHNIMLCGRLRRRSQIRALFLNAKKPK